MLEAVEGPKEERVPVVRVSSPSNLREISLNISICLEKEKTECVIFDSVSTLMLFMPPLEVLKFMHEIIRRLRKHDAKGVIMVLKEDLHRQYLDELSMFVDAILERSELSKTLAEKGTGQPVVSLL
jgi:archaellum biogenesis ATPase FlaH